MEAQVDGRPDRVFANRLQSSSSISLSVRSGIPLLSPSELNTSFFSSSNSSNALILTKEVPACFLMNMYTPFTFGCPSKVICIVHIGKPNQQTESTDVHIFWNRSKLLSDTQKSGHIRRARRKTLYNTMAQGKSINFHTLRSKANLGTF